jgi:hypothetical protein
MKVAPCVTLIRETSEDLAQAADGGHGPVARFLRRTAESLIRHFPPLKAYGTPGIRNTLTALPFVGPIIGEVYRSADESCEEALRQREDWERIKSGRKE